MLDLSKSEHRELLLKVGVSESKVAVMYEKQKRGEKLSGWIKINVDGKDTIIRMPESPEEIEERKRKDREIRIQKNEYQRNHRKYLKKSPDEKRKIDEIKYEQQSIKRYWEKVDKKGIDECWNWLASINQDGYGNFTYHGKIINAHIMSCIIHKIEIPKGKEVTHICNNRKCQNPNHFKIDTHSNNLKYMVDTGRAVHPKGNECSFIKITENQVIEIKRRLLNGDMQKDIAKDYGISKQLVSSIKCGLCWRHVKI